MDNITDIKISVIMPIYNASDYLKPAIDSVLNQTLTELELICVDDGSTDNSLEILKQYQESDERVRIITETNAGPALARNNGIRRSRGEYLAFVDADDFLEPTFLEVLYAIAKHDSLDIAISRFDIYNNKKSKFEVPVKADHSDIYSDGVVTSKSEHPDYILSSTVGSAWNKLFRRSFVVEKQLEFLPDVRIYEDVYFVVTALSLAERIGKVQDILIHHRIHSEQSRAKMFKKHYSQVPLVYSRIREFLTQNGMYAPLSRSYLNLSASRCYKMFNLLSGDSKENLWNILHEDASDKLDWQGRAADDFESEDVCKFVSDVCRYRYKDYKRRESRAEKINESKPASNGEKRGIFAFFKGLFGKK